MRISNLLRKTIEWLKSILSESISKAIVNLFSKFFFWLILFLLSLLLLSFAPSLRKRIDLPLYILLILGLLAFLGLLTIISTAFKNRQTQRITKRLVQLKFEDYPRTWRAYCTYNGFEWRTSSSISVYCSVHNLELQPTILGDHIVTICPDCEREEITNLDEESTFHIAVHCNYKYSSEFYDEVRSRIRRECDKISSKN